MIRDVGFTICKGETLEGAIRNLAQAFVVYRDIAQDEQVLQNKE